MTLTIQRGPLSKIKVLEVHGIGPAPFAAMTLAGLGASVLRVSRPGKATGATTNPVMDRGRCGQVKIDLKSASGRSEMLELVRQADVLIEGFRPNVMERLGLGPEECLALNPKLIYGRITGWGRSGPLAQSAGHDINYIALSGALHACGTAESGPMPPLNLVGDFGGGGMLLALGITAALFEARISGHGQVVDAAMLDGAAMLMSMMYGFRANGRWPASRAGNFLDGSAYFYTCYQCADGEWIAVGAIEPYFRAAFLECLGLAADADLISQSPPNDPAIRRRIAGIFLKRTRQEWESAFEGYEACVSPVLSIDEAADHAQNIAWGSLRRVAGVNQPMAAPRFSRTPTIPPDDPVCHEELLQGWQLETLSISPIC